MNFFIFGDSITYGAWDSEGGWAARLRKYIDKKGLFEQVYNLGISGDKTTDLLERFDAELNARIDQDEETFLLFAIGTNDSQFSNTDKQFRVSEQDFQKNIAVLIEQARKYTQKIAFVSLVPVDNTKVDPTPWTPDRSYKLENIQHYNDLLTETCSKLSVPVIDAYSAFSKGDFNALLQDGLHPNDAGHQLIFETVKNYFEKTLWQQK